MSALQSGQIGIVIVNWNSGNLLRRCLQSLSAVQSLDRVSQVVIVDNESHDGSCDALPLLGVPLFVIHNNSNRGFAAACNQGAAICSSEYLLFLNPDSELQANSLCQPLAYLDAPEHQDVGICGIQLLDARGNVARSCSRLPTCYSLVTMALRLSRLSKHLFPLHFMKEWDHAQTRSVEQVIGAFFLVRFGLFLQLGGFDERFFVYFEEVDFCERTRQLGLKTVYLASAQALHLGAGCTAQVKGYSLFYSLSSRLAYAQKHFPAWQSMLVIASTMIAEPMIRLMAASIKFRWQSIGPLLFAFGNLWLRRFTRAPSNQSATVEQCEPKNRESARVAA
jgi:N-acetylglucosaminyl-diphospho-decaprenol L-rhamnosyltransferase